MMLYSLPISIREVPIPPPIYAISSNVMEGNFKKAIMLQTLHTPLLKLVHDLELQNQH